MSWKEFLNPNRIKWWRKDEWVSVDRYIVKEVLDEHGCPSWTVRPVIVKRYKNKEDCEERMRISNKLDTERTVFSDPEEDDPVLLRKVKIFDGPDYEDK